MHSVRRPARSTAGAPVVHGVTAKPSALKISRRRSRDRACPRRPESWSLQLLRPDPRGRGFRLVFPCGAKRRVKAEPSPGVLSTAMVPPRALANSRQMASPARCPCPALWLCRRARRFGADPRVRCRSPVSRTVMSTWSSCGRAVSATRPPASTASSALESRLNHDLPQQARVGDKVSRIIGQGPR